MSLEGQPRGTGEKFTEVLEAQIAEGRGIFEDRNTSLIAAMRGLAGRLNGRFVPVGLVMATELYVTDMNRGKDGYTGEPMPPEVTRMAPMGGAIVRIAMADV